MIGSTVRRPAPVFKIKKAKAGVLDGRFKVIAHNGTKILVLQYEHCTYEVAGELTDYFDRWISRQRPNSANVLFDVNNCCYDYRLVKRWKNRLGYYDTFIRKSAVINASPFIASLVPTIRMFAKFVGMPMKGERGILFMERKAALDWLAAL